MSKVRILHHEDQEWVLKSEYDRHKNLLRKQCNYTADLHETIDAIKEALNEIDNILCSQTYNDAFDIVEKALESIKKLETKK